MHQLIPTSITARSRINIPCVTLLAQVEVTTCRLDDATIDDLTGDDTPEADEDAVWDKVIEEAEREKWEDK